MAKITGIGGVFFKAKSDPKALAAWYAENLGLILDPTFGGAVLRWPEDGGRDGGATVWHVAKQDTTWFHPGGASFMINYRVDDMAGLIAHLNARGVEIVGGPEHHENGVFAWILDLDGNKVELWQPESWDEKNQRNV